MTQVPGAMNVEQMLVQSRYLSQEDVDPSLIRSLEESAPGHDYGPSTTQGLGSRRVMKARAADPSGQIRRFKVLANLNFDDVKYLNVINWEFFCPITEPPVNKAMTDAELRDIITTDVT